METQVQTSQEETPPEAFEPLGALPVDLRGLLRALLRGYEPGLRRVCRAWRAWAAVTDKEASSRLWEAFLARRGEAGLLAWWRAERGADFDPEMVLLEAAGAGQLEVLRQAQEAWGARAYEPALVWAAKGGQLTAMRQLRAWGVQSYDWALVWAAKGGHLKAMEQLRAWRDQAHNRAIIRSARGGQLEALQARLEAWQRAEEEEAGEGPGGRH